jgi:hypothetical protein
MALIRAGAMKIVDCRDNVVDQFCEGPPRRGRPADDDIIMPHPKTTLCTDSHRLLEAPSNAVALDRSAELARHREADPRGFVILAASDLHDGSLHSPRPPARRGQEILPSDEALHEGSSFGYRKGTSRLDYV